MKIEKRAIGKRGRRKKKYIPYDYETAFNKSLENLHELFVKEMQKKKHKSIYALKEIRAGQTLEIEIYPEFTNMEDIPEKEKKDNSKAQKKLNNKNAVKHVVRMIEHNFTNSDLWLTLTYDAEHEPKTMDEALINIQNYIKRINYRRKKKGLPNAKYIYVTEYAPDNKVRYHHHIIIDGALDRDTCEKIWKKGTRHHTRRLERDDNGLTGIAHYITKNDSRKKNEKRWKASKNLEKYKERKVYSKKDINNKYKPISKHVDNFIKNQNEIENQCKKWYPDYTFTDSEIYYNDFNGRFYIKAKMRKTRKEKQKE